MNSSAVSFPRPPTELRNPLTAILGEVEVPLHKSRPEREYVESLRKIPGEAERLQALTASLLSLSWSGQPPKDLRLEAIRMDEFLWELQVPFGQHFPAGGRLVSRAGRGGKLLDELLVVIT